ncbi:hypothetical protein NZK35_08115 [Stieleria sp. ICT_E10.1]|uniref:hypothetical protein n=1 Tax=Stieleria sedimenti TaxID=2976331 RepID=UPI00217FD4EE|nr:hypothetical protein [Stieleria sedimenti]MCS7466606.1 hypothetical protein [Stieleria sedimenti]
MFFHAPFRARRYSLALILITACLVMPMIGCGGSAAPEIDTDVAAEIQAEDEAVIDAESEL